MIRQGVLLTGSGTVYIRRYCRRRRWRRYVSGRLMSGLVLLFLLMVTAACCYAVVSCYSRSLMPEVSEIIMEQADAVSVPNVRQIPLQAEYVMAGFAFTGGYDSYYAGPTEGVVKEPEEIRIALDPGHGGVDDGCVKGGILEKDLNLSIAIGVKERLEEMGYQVILTRDSDCGLSLKERVKLAKKAHADIYVSIHQNSSELSNVNGIELYYSAQNAGDDSRRLAERIQEQAIQDTGANARSIFEWEELYVIRESAMPSCLIETGFLTNAKERGRLKTSEYQGRIADGIVAGIDQYFNP